MYIKLGFKFNGQRFNEKEWAVKIYQKLLNEEYLMELNYWENIKRDMHKFIKNVTNINMTIIAHI